MGKMGKMDRRDCFLQLFVHVAGTGAEGGVLSGGRRRKNSREAQVCRKKRRQRSLQLCPGYWRKVQELRIS